MKASRPINLRGEDEPDAIDSGTLKLSYTVSPAGD